MKLIDLMKQSMNEKRNMIVADGYNNLYRLELCDNFTNCTMYEHSNTTHLAVTVDITYDMISNQYYYEL